MFCRALYFGGAFKKQQQQNFCDFFFIPKVDQFKETFTTGIYLHYSKDEYFQILKT